MSKTKKDDLPLPEKHTPSKGIKDEDQLIEEGLQAIYGNGEKVDFTKIDRRRNRLTNILLTVVATLAVVAVASWGAFFAYNKYFTESADETFTLEIEVDDELVSGQAASIAIRYGNPSDVPITGLELDVRLPPSFIVENLSPTPANIEDRIWSIGNLSAGSSGMLVIEGTWVALVPSSTPVQVLANYKPANFNADFQDIETVYVQTRDSTIQLAFAGPEEATPGETLEYSIEVKNSGVKTFEGVTLALALPDGFFLESSDPEIVSGRPTEWTFEEVLPEEPQTITFEGSFAGDVSGFQYFDMDLSVSDAQDRKLTQRTDRGFTDLLTSDLTTQLIVNGGTENVNADLGDNLRMSITLENAGEAAREDVELLLSFDAEDPLPVIWDDAELDDGTITSEGIVWDAEVIGTLDAGERVLINITVPVVASIGGQADRFTLVATASEGDIRVSSSPVVIAINSEAELTAYGRYFTEDGAPLGAGPVPPQVGEKTTYRIYWEIENSLHDLKDIELSTELPPNVSFEGQAFSDLGTIEYHDGTGRVTWKISTLSNEISTLRGYFAVSVTPSEDDVGKFIKLTGEHTLRAKDVTNDSDLSSKSDGLTTEVEGDEFASGMGVVVEGEGE